MLIICCIVECPLFKGQSAPTVFSCLAVVMSILINVSPERRERIELGQMWALQICATWHNCSSSLVLAHLKRFLGQHYSVSECIHSGECSGSMSVVNIRILHLITFPSSLPSHYISEESGINVWLLSNTWKVASQLTLHTGQSSRFHPKSIAKVDRSGAGVELSAVSHWREDGCTFTG